MQNMLIFGAGAIGRGFLGLLLQEHDIELSYVDIDEKIIEPIKHHRSYKAALTEETRYEIKEIRVKDAFYPHEKIDIASYDLVFSCVGPNNCYDLAEKLRKAKTVISCENDASTVDKLKELSGNKHIYFGIPDVITSNTASKELLHQDPLMTITEKGVLVLERGNYDLPNSIPQLEKNELNMHWMCKLFIHNAPHAIIAYLGWLKGYVYIHEAMEDPEIADIVEGSINEITDGIIAANYASKEFAEAYKQKELKRFKNKLLFDPIERVAREPLRKLSKDNRIILGMRAIQFNGVMPKFTAIGAKAALTYDNLNDSEAQYLQNLRQTIGDQEVLRRTSGLEIFDPLNRYIVDQDLSRFAHRN